MVYNYEPFIKSISYDGVYLTDVFTINNINIQRLPSASLTAQSVPNHVGTIFQSFDMAERTITLSLALPMTDRNMHRIEMQWNTVMSLLIKDEPKKLYIEDGWYINAIVTEISDVERQVTKSVREVTFTATDPWFYSNKRTVQLQSGSNSLYIANSYELYPLLTLTGCRPTLTIRHNTGDQIVIPSGFSTTNTITVDMEHERCNVNSSYLPVTNELTDFFTLKPGNNTITLSSGSGTLTYQERRL